MTFTPARFVDPRVLTTSNADLYTAVSQQALIRQFIFTNTTASVVTVTVNIIPSGGTADGTNSIVSQLNVAAHDTVPFNCWVVLNTGDKINGKAGTGAALIITASGGLLA